jgi:RNA polymerase sigma-70 factor (ECF subfamily)
MPIDREGAGASQHTTASGELLERARAGDERALSALFRRHAGKLQRWARGRLPNWARRVNDTADLVQDALLQTFRRIDRFENRGRGALQAYLRQAVDNRIRDEMRRVARRPTADLEDEVAPDPEAPDASPFDVAADSERERRYKQALSRLDEEERVLVVARLELGYTYEQLALVANRPTAEAARMAVRRAVTKLATLMAGV